MSKFIRIVVIIILFIVVLFFIAINIYVRLKGPVIITQKLREVFQREVSLGGVRYQFPLGFRLNDLEIVSAFSVKQADVTLGFSQWGSKQIVFSRIFLKSPQFSVERTDDSKLSWAAFAETKYHGGPSGSPEDKSNVSGSNDQEETKPPVTTQEDTIDTMRPSIAKTLNKMWKHKVYVRKIRIIDGGIKLVDYTYSPELRISIGDMYLEMGPVAYPFTGLKTSIQCAGAVKESNTFFKGGWVEGTGWLNFLEKDMDVNLNVIEPDGTTGLEAHLTAQKNDVLVKGHMKLISNRKPSAEPGQMNPSPADEFWQSLKLQGIDMNIQFSFQTKMDNFHIGRVSIQGDLGVDGLGDL